MNTCILGMMNEKNKTFTSLRKTTFDVNLKQTIKVLLQKYNESNDWLRYVYYVISLL